MPTPHQQVTQILNQIAQHNINLFDAAKQLAAIPVMPVNPDVTLLSIVSDYMAGTLATNDVYTALGV